MVSSFEFTPLRKNLLIEARQRLQDFSVNNAIAQRSPQEAMASPAAGIAPCFNCGSTRINLVEMPSYSAHYAARRCADCDAFQGWEPKPENQERQQQRQLIINQLLKSPQLSQWEREFLTSVQGKRSLSPKQLATIQKIETKLGAAQ